MEHGPAAERVTLRTAHHPDHPTRTRVWCCGRICPDRARADVTAEDFMSAGTGQAEGSAPAPQPAQPGAPATSANATVPTANWHHEIVSRIDRWAWIRTLNDQLTAVLGPWRERHQDNPVLELMHGGRWLGHPLHPALSDLPIGLWAGSLLLDAIDRDPAPGLDPAPRRGLDPAGLFSAVGIVAAVATAATGVVDWTVSDDEDRRLGLFHGVL